MKATCWIRYWGDIQDQLKEEIAAALKCEGIVAEPCTGDCEDMLGICFISRAIDDPAGLLPARHSHVIAVIMSPHVHTDMSGWNFLLAGAADVLFWTDLKSVALQIRARFQRWLFIDQLFRQAVVNDIVIGESPAWRSALRGIIETAHFGDTSILLLGESGTGKEVTAKLIHDLDPQPQKKDMVILDCSTIVPELSGSEFFGHERGAFTGALTERQGAFALADGGTLFLDEIGELPLPLQAQLLRVIQEHSYKRVGGSTWHRAKFRLICATNRDLSEMVQRGAFRADLYFRIAGFVTRLPPLRERLEDVLPLAEHFIRKMHRASKPPKLDHAVRRYLLQRSYPGNVRDLQQVVARLIYRCTEDGTISIGYIPHDERPAEALLPQCWLDSNFEGLIHRAVLMGAGLKEIGRAAEDCAIHCATRIENGSLQRAALRLGVTDRALQIRRANMRELTDGYTGASRFHS